MSEQFTVVVRVDEIPVDILDDETMLQEVMYSIWRNSVEDHGGTPVSANHKLSIRRFDAIPGVGIEVIRAVGWADR